MTMERMDWARDAVLAALLDRVPVGGPIEEETLLELAHAFGPELLLALDLVDTEQVHLLPRPFDASSPLRGNAPAHTRAYQSQADGFLTYPALSLCTCGASPPCRHLLATLIALRLERAHQEPSTLVLARAFQMRVGAAAAVGAAAGGGEPDEPETRAGA